MATTAKPKDLNSEVEWRYQSIRNQALAELLTLPQTKIASIEAGAKRQ